MLAMYMALIDDESDKEKFERLYNTYETMFMLVVFYMIILLPLSLVLSFVERRMRYAEHGN